MQLNDDYPALSSIEAEGRVLGCILSNDSLLESLPFLNESHFNSAAHKAMFDVICKQVSKGLPANPITIRVEVAKRVDFPECESGGVLEAGKYLVSLVTGSTRCLDLVGEANYLVELSQRRALKEACDAAVSTLGDIDASPAAEAALKLATTFEEVARGSGASCFVAGNKVAEAIIERLKNPAPPAHSTGLRKLDLAMEGGLYPGKAYGFAARKKIGKSILAATLSHNLDRAGVKHLFICGEMGREEMEERVLSRVLECYPSAFRSEYGRSPAFLAKLAEAALTRRQHCLYHDAPGLTFDDLRRSVTTAIMQHRISGFILDYWQLVGGKAKNQSDAAHLDEVAQWIANTCRKYKVWAVVMGQINQTGNTRGGEGMRLAFDQVYHLQPCFSTGDTDPGDHTQPHRWMEMMDSRYTQYMNLGDTNNPGVIIRDKGLFFDEL